MVTKVIAGPTSVRALASSFELSLAASNKSPRTIETYLTSVRLFTGYLEENGMPAVVSGVHREHVEAFMERELRRTKPASVSIRYRSLQSFFKWCVAEGELTSSPMANMTPPIIPEQPVPVLPLEQIQALLKACTGAQHADRRDLALIRLFMDTGIRRAELAGLKVDDLDLKTRTATVLGKGRRIRTVSFGHRTAQALDRYLRARASHRYAYEPALWLGIDGPMTPNGIAQAVRRRGRRAGIPDRVNLHRFRHTFAHEWLANGGQGEELMALNGWKSRSMLTRYGASAATERALAAHKRLALGDRL
jgi:site-specific recombinase XerD